MRRRGGPLGVEGWLAVALGLGTIIALAVLGSRRPSLELLWGDEPTYVAMAQSLAFDRDLLFDEGDLARGRQLTPPGPDGLILQRTERGITYSKPILYPLLAAPFVGLFGANGAIAINVAALTVGFALAGCYLRRIGATDRALLTLVTFATAGCLLPYVVWRMSESLEVGLVLAGLVLGIGWTRGAPDAGGWLDGRVASLVAGASLGLAASLRYPNAAIVVAVVAAALYGRRPGRAAFTALGGVAGFVAVCALTWALTGAVNPYRTLRSGFGPDVGYPVGPEAAVGLARFDQEPAINLVGILPLDAAESLHAGLYFLIGRHTGLLFYLPVAVVFASFIALRGDGIGRILLAGGAVIASFYLVWVPENYFGGGTFVGNRYLLAAYPVTLIGLARLPGRRLLATVWCVAAIGLASAAVSVFRTAALDRTSQSHAHAGIFRLLPYESTGRNLDGSRDRYWGGDFVRFVDPYAEVGERWFRPIGPAAAELMIASHPPRASFRFAVRGAPPGTTLAFRDRRGEQRLPLGDDGRVSVELAPAWRQHRFWFFPQVDYTVHTFRIAVHDADGRVIPAEIRYLGREGAAAAR